MLAGDPSRPNSTVRSAKQQPKVSQWPGNIERTPPTMDYLSSHSEATLRTLQSHRSITILNRQMLVVKSESTLGKLVMALYPNYQLLPKIYLDSKERSIGVPVGT